MLAEPLPGIGGAVSVEQLVDPTCSFDGKTHFEKDKFDEIEQSRVDWDEGTKITASPKDYDDWANKSFDKLTTTKKSKKRAKKEKVKQPKIASTKNKAEADKAYNVVSIKPRLYFLVHLFQYYL